MNAKLSEVIERLNFLMKEHGDVSVCCAEIEGGGYGEIQKEDLNEVIMFIPQSKSIWTSRKEDYPECVSISL